LWGYLRYVERPAIKTYLLLLLLFALGLMAKPMLVTLPFVLLLLDYWPLGRLQIGPLSRETDTGKRSPVLGLVWEKIPLFVLSTASCVVTFLAQKNGGAVATLDYITPGARIGNSLVSYERYIGKMLWPQHLAFFYPRPSVLPGWQTAGVQLLLLSISSLIIRTFKGKPYLSVGWLWYLGTLVPVIGLVQVEAPSNGRSLHLCSPHRPICHDCLGCSRIYGKKGLHADRFFRSSSLGNYGTFCNYLDTGRVLD